jgi:TetR/AcrR family transcriptional regulator, cholesterol catabolism regulator
LEPLTPDTIATGPADQPAADNKRRKIVASASELFDRVGYHSVNVGALATAVGIRKPTLYHYFSGKDEILFWIHVDLIKILMDRAKARPTTLPAAVALRQIIGDILGLMTSHRGHVRVFFEHHRELSGENRITISRKRDSYQRHVESIIERGIANTEFREIDPKLAALALFGTCNWSYQWFQPDGRLTSDEVADVFFDLLLNGLRK